jgi:hypothetical protein
LSDPARAARIALQAEHDVAGLTWEARARRILAFAGVPVAQVPQGVPR